MGLQASLWCCRPSFDPGNESSWPKEQTSGKTKQCLWVKEVALGGEEIILAFFLKACITPVKRKHFRNSSGPEGVQRHGDVAWSQTGGPGVWGPGPQAQNLHFTHLSVKSGLWSPVYRVTMTAGCDVRWICFSRSDLKCLLCV